ncbi:Tat binding protein 1-interacting [Dendryphion nanum]|uniref:Tat binding protein 1-interacting n=1 Tax=Dendryphion nanum TaxID=256645 RepID=A0A9P9IYD2_9PLEO|nr:Tat binding protein 1-interacting [Dendryphion nanum]
MAPRREKTEKVSANEAADTILNYLRKQNRPYSATDISANLHNKVTKTAAQKILKDLSDAQKIESRSAGKQVVFYALQNTSDAMTPSQLATLDTTIDTLRTQTTALLATAKTLRTTLSTLNSTLSTSDLITSVSSLENEKAEIEARLEILRAGKATKVIKGEMERVEEERRKWNGVARRREKIVGVMWGLIEDVLSDRERRDEVREGLGLDE